MMIGESAWFPILNHTDQKVVDPGKVRLGDGIITAEFPLKD